MPRNDSPGGVDAALNPPAATAVELPRLPVVPAHAQSLGRRDSQQDAFGFSSLADTAFARHAGYLAVLADGMGGVQNGSWASSEAVRTFLDGYRAKTRDEETQAALLRAATMANEVVFTEADRLNLVDRMGTTLVAAVIRDRELNWLSIGDSRVYLFDAGRLVRLSTDHSFSEVLRERVVRGEISLGESLEHPMRNGLTSYLGRRETPLIDASRSPLRLNPGAWVLLCSDGLSGVLNESEIAAELHGVPQAACDRLIHAVTARHLPHQDNTTVMVLHVPEAAGAVLGRQAALPDRTAARRPRTPGFGPAAWVAGFASTASVILAVALVQTTNAPPSLVEESRPAIPVAIIGTNEPPAHDMAVTAVPSELEPVLASAVPASPAPSGRPPAKPASVSGKSTSKTKAGTAKPGKVISHSTKVTPSATTKPENQPVAADPDKLSGDKGSGVTEAGKPTEPSMNPAVPVPNRAVGSEVKAAPGAEQNPRDVAAPSSTQPPPAKPDEKKTGDQTGMPPGPTSSQRQRI